MARKKKAVKRRKIVAKVKISPLSKQELKIADTFRHPGQVILALRMCKNTALTYRSIAILLGVSTNTVQKWCQKAKIKRPGKRRPR